MARGLEMCVVDGVNACLLAGSDKKCTRLRIVTRQTALTAKKRVPTLSRMGRAGICNVPIVIFSHRLPATTSSQETIDVEVIKAQVLTQMV
jgi:hypothetical protein